MLTYKDTKMLITYHNQAYILDESGHVVLNPRYNSFDDIQMEVTAPFHLSYGI